ncbi:MAG: hypothetical protein KJ847_02130 [Firmicutes bacterium]|nr:hypothetical protein [Bacillota bacterium]
MISKFELTQLDLCTDFIIKCNCDKGMGRYFPTNKDEINKRISKRLDQNDVDILMYKSNKGIEGYLELLIDHEENYLQILAFFAGEEFSFIFEQYFIYMKENYNSYKLHYVVSDFNTDSINYMKKTSATSDGAEIMMHITKGDFKSIKTSGIVSLQPNHEEAFVRLHDSLTLGAYWTGKLILEKNDTFNKIVMEEDDKVIGYSIISNSNRDEEEIYFIFAKNDEKKLELINDSLTIGFKTAKSIQLLLDNNEASIIPNLYKLGFKEKERIITYYMESIT